MKTLLVLAGITVFVYGFIGEFVFSPTLFLQSAYAVICLCGSGLVAIGLMER
jgi:hypothetical protein